MMRCMKSGVFISKERRDNEPLRRADYLENKKGKYRVDLTSTDRE